MWLWLLSDLVSHTSKIRGCKWVYQLIRNVTSTCNICINNKKLLLSVIYKIIFVIILQRNSVEKETDREREKKEHKLSKRRCDLLKIINIINFAFYTLSRDSYYYHWLLLMIYIRAYISCVTSIFMLCVILLNCKVEFTISLQETVSSGL